MSLLGRKVGMTRLYTDKGVSLPVTVIKCGPCVVTQLRTTEKDGYTAVQIGYEDVDPRNSTRPVIKHDFIAGTTPKRFHREFRCDEKTLANYQLGQEIKVDALNGTLYVDVIGTSKGKGFAGVMKRYRFKGLCASHGTERKHRSPGSIGSLCSNRGFGGGVKKGKRMAGHMGDARITTRSMDVVRVDADQNLLIVKGTVAGGKNGFVEIRPATRLYKSKANKVKAASK
ncbi:MAG: 50S ribosomal protein L3 [Phycisphaerales bacterium]|jgi:large subunit ribosomal protein L3